MNGLRRIIKRGQSTVEYIIVVAGVLAVLLIFLGPKGIFKKTIDATLATGSDGMEDMASRLGSSYGFGSGGGNPPVGGDGGTSGNPGGPMPK